MTFVVSWVVVDGQRSKLGHAAVAGAVEFDSVSEPPQPMLSAVTAKSIKKNRMIDWSLSEMK